MTSIEQQLIENTPVELSTIIKISTGNATHPWLTPADARAIFADWMYAPGQADIHWVLILPFGMGHRFYPNPKWVCTDAACPCRSSLVTRK